MLERHHRRRDRDAALLFDLHPVRLGAPVLAPRPHRPRRPRNAPVDHYEFYDHDGVRLQKVLALLLVLGDLRDQVRAA